MNFQNVARVMAVAIYDVNMNDRMNMSWVKERQGQLKERARDRGRI